MYLTKIIDYKKQELEHVKRRVSLKDLRLKAEASEPARSFLEMLKSPPPPFVKGGISIIAEIKKASPSAGIIRPDFDPVHIAQVYEQNGAAALSILTDEHFFQGKLEFLDLIKKHVALPLLRKDFTLDAYHVFEARGAGADAVLLIVRVLEDAQLKDYSDLAHELGMAVLIEVHDEKEMERVKKNSPQLVGINNRNLDTFKVDLETTVQLSKKAPENTLLVSESGISTPEHVKKMRDVGVHAFLVGESLLREKDLGKKLRELLNH